MNDFSIEAELACCIGLFDYARLYPYCLKSCFIYYSALTIPSGYTRYLVATDSQLRQAETFITIIIVTINIIIITIIIIIMMIINSYNTSTWRWNLHDTQMIQVVVK